MSFSYAYQIGLCNPHSVVSEALNAPLPELSEEEILQLYQYDVPEMGPQGSCRISKKKAADPFLLSEFLGLPQDSSSLQHHAHTERIWRLYEIIEALYQRTDCDWLGIYRKATNPVGERVLVKEAYRGAFSRAEFPLNEDFAENSNNATVGLSGKAVLINSVADHSGPYYQCDVDVQSEFCVPILSPAGEILGIIDAEAFTENFFTPQRVLEISRCCQDLGASELLKMA